MAGDVSLRLLDRVQIASPCSMRWEDMTGDDRVRHCEQCNLNVFNLSSMTEDEAEALLASKGESRLCAAFFRRADGTVLTRDCPVGLRAVRQRAARAALRVAALLAFVITGGALARANTSSDAGLRRVQPFARTCDWLSRYLPGAKAPPVPVRMTAGSVCLPAPPQPGRASASTGGQ